MKYFTEFVASFSLGSVQIKDNMAVVALNHAQKHDFNYICLKEALEKELLDIREVDQHGAVPILMAVNKGPLPILILDGEELVGGKQNRVLNTTILLKEKSKTVPSRRFSSPGHGWDYRFLGDNLAGSALLWRQKIIHTAFFQIPPNSSDGHLAGPGHRLRFRL